MLSQRRLRLYVVVVVVLLLAFTYFTTDSGGGVQNHHFYKKTVTAIDNAHAATLKKNNDVKDRSHIQRLDIDNNNNNNNNNNNGAQKASSSNKVENSDEISVAGRTKMSIPKPKEEQIQLSDNKPEVAPAPAPAPAVPAVPAVSAAEKKPAQVQSDSKVATEYDHEVTKEEQEEQEASTELDLILKRSPIIVFSKSYCPYSRKAKSILSEYDIVPAPYVVELDKHPLGPHLQKLLGTITGRRTVPNVLINGLSIGGGDDVEALDRNDALISKIKSVGGKNIVEIEHLQATAESEIKHDI